MHPMSREEAEAIVKIARQRRALMDRLKTALEHVDPAWLKDLTLPIALREALVLARQATGLDRPGEEANDESRRLDKNIH